MSIMHESKKQTSRVELSFAPEFKAPELQKYKPSFEGTTRSAMMMQQEKLINAQAANLNTQSELNKYYGLEVLSKIDLNHLDAESRKMYNEVYRHQMAALMERPYIENQILDQELGIAVQNLGIAIKENNYKDEEYYKRKVSDELSKITLNEAQATKVLSDAGLNEHVGKKINEEYKNLIVQGRILNLEEAIRGWEKEFKLSHGTIIEYLKALNAGEVVSALVDLIPTKLFKEIVDKYEFPGGSRTVTRSRGNR